MFILLSLCIYIYTFYYTKKNFSAYILMPGFIFSSILMVSQTVYYYFSTHPEITEYFKIGVFKTFDYNYKVFIVHQLYMLACFFSLYKIKNKDSDIDSSRKGIRSRIADVLNKKYFPLNYKTMRFYYLLFMVLLVMTVYHFNNLDAQILWKNNQYLLLGNPTELGLPLIAGLIHYVAGIIAILILILILLLFKSKRYLLGGLLIPFFLYYLMLKVAGNSRWGPLIIVSALPFLYKPRSIRSVISIICTLILTFSLYFGALYGRRGHYNSQGVSAIPSNIKSGITIAVVLFPKIMGTAFSSSWNLALAIKKFENKDVKFDTKYKILVFSPLISSIDGYSDKLEEKNKLKLSPYAPVGFIGETYFLGPGYFLFVIVFLFFAIRYCNKIVAKYNLIGMMIISPAFLFFFKMQGYPVRNCFRYLLLGIVFGFIFDWFQKRKGKRAPQLEEYFGRFSNT